MQPNAVDSGISCWKWKRRSCQRKDTYRYCSITKLEKISFGSVDMLLLLKSLRKRVERTNNAKNRLT